MKSTFLGQVFLAIPLLECGLGIALQKLAKAIKTLPGFWLSPRPAGDQDTPNKVELGIRTLGFNA